MIIIKVYGIKRKIDRLGRVVIPKELRKQFNISVNEPLEIILTQDGILLTKVVKKCCICESEINLNAVDSNYVCTKCIELIKGG